MPAMRRPPQLPGLLEQLGQEEILFRIQTPDYCAGGIIRNDLVIKTAPILRKKLYWKTAKDVQRVAKEDGGTVQFFS